MLKIGLVVMTTHGRGVFSQFWIGSVTDEFLRQASIPVLLVRPDHGLAEIRAHAECKRILVPLDGSPLSENILEPARLLGESMNSEYTLLRIVAPPPRFPDTDSSYALRELDHVRAVNREATDYLAGIAERMRSYGCRVETRVVVNGSVAHAIMQESLELGMDLIAMATHGRSGLPRMFLGSVADKVLRGATIPLLLVSRGWHSAHAHAN